MDRAILHIDMDAFFASVEQRDHPELRGKPVLVGGMHRGVVAAASYEARRYGIHSAMPMQKALQLCPHAVVVTPMHGRYAAVSRQIFAIFARYTPLIEGLSLDEAFLDVTHSQRLFGDATDIAQNIRDAIRKELGLTASAGVAPCKFVAKIASDIRKPDGLMVVVRGDVEAFLEPLPLERIWGVGPKAAQRLRSYGLQTIGDLSRVSAETLETWLGSWGRTVSALARGIDTRPVEPDQRAKSVSAEDTFDADITNIEGLERHVLAQSSRVAQRLIRGNLCGQVVVLKVKFADFTLLSRRMKLDTPVADTDSIYVAAKQLLRRLDYSKDAVRLTGVGVAELYEGPPPRTLFPDVEREKRLAVERLASAVGERFGTSRLMRATLLE